MRDLASHWNTTAEERIAPYPCDRHMQGPYEHFMRAVDVDAPTQVMFRWLCQPKVASYSYDWIDNLGRRSPRTLTPGTEDLEVGQELLVFRLLEFEPDRHITGVILPRSERLFGPLAVSYVVEPRGVDRCRLVARIDAPAPSSVDEALRRTDRQGSRRPLSASVDVRPRRVTRYLPPPLCHARAGVLRL